MKMPLGQILAFWLAESIGDWALKIRQMGPINFKFFIYFFIYFLSVFPHFVRLIEVDFELIKGDLCRGN